MEARIETSPDAGVTWYAVVPSIGNSADATPHASQVASYTATGTFQLLVRSLARHETQVRIAVKATGGTPTGTIVAQIMFRSSPNPISGNVV